MQITKKNVSATTAKLDIAATEAELSETKQQVLKNLGKTVKLQGFRAGKAPLSLVEKNVDPTIFQNEFLDTLINRLYVDAVSQEKLRPVASPQISLTKFVPFTTLEFSAELEVVGEVKLPDYKKFKLAKPSIKIEAKDVNEVLDNLKTRMAEKKDVTRAAKAGDEVVIDFAGVDDKTGEPIKGADGKDYPLILGSDAFIPGFETHLIGLKAGAEKTFVLVFPKDYSVTALQSRKVSFTVTVTRVQEVADTKIDDAFAAKVSPFPTLAELKADIKRQLLAERQTQADRDYESQLLEQIAQKASVAIPDVLIEEEIDRIEQDERQNLTYRGQTWQEHLELEGVTEAEHHEKQRPGAELRVRAGLVLSDIATQEGIFVTPEELEIRMQLLKGQYTDAAMQAELEKPETRRDIANRLLSEKTIAQLTIYATSK